jgi:tryptophan 7-halogenase
LSDSVPLAGSRTSAGRHIRRVAVVGGGTAGWLAASMLARALSGSGTSIVVVESPEIGTVGVGEATIPPIIDLIAFLGIDLADFVSNTQATFKLGIRFLDWRVSGRSYWHPFGTFGSTLHRRPFHHYWHRARAAGAPLSFNDFSLCAALGEVNRFRFPDHTAQGPASGLRYALHFDATLVARYLRAYAERCGVTRLERTVAGATLTHDGFLDELVFSDHSRLGADFYLDCSGARAVLIEQTLKTGYLSWRDVLPCDRAVAMPTAISGPRAPYTQALARAAGWHWRIPLQHRIGNGYVYASEHLDDEQALADLTGQAGGGCAEPRLLRFQTGRRRAPWHRNCVALGLASGFLEPLESTSIHLVTSGLYHLLEHFPDRDFEQANIDAYNRRVIEEFEGIRDFIVLHYCLTQRRDTPFWRYCADMAIPPSLRERIDLYRGTGRVHVRAGELFTDLSWFYVLDGLGVEPRSYDPLVDGAAAQVSVGLQTLRSQLLQEVRQAQLHDTFFAPSSPFAAREQPTGTRPLAHADRALTRAHDGARAGSPAAVRQDGRVDPSGRS